MAHKLVKNSTFNSNNKIGANLKQVSMFLLTKNCCYCFGVFFGGGAGNILLCIAEVWEPGFLTPSRDAVWEYFKTLAMRSGRALPRCFVFFSLQCTNPPPTPQHFPPWGLSGFQRPHADWKYRELVTSRKQPITGKASVQIPKGLASSHDKLGAFCALAPSIHQRDSALSPMEEPASWAAITPHPTAHAPSIPK